MPSRYGWLLLRVGFMGRPEAHMISGYALAVAPVIWQSLNEKERTNVEAWLGNSINEKK